MDAAHRRLPPAALPALRTWIRSQRWYAAKGTDEAPRLSVHTMAPTPAGDLVEVLAEAGGVLHRVPLLVGPGAGAGVPPRAVLFDDGATVVDACHTVAHARWLLGAVAPGTEVHSARVLPGEQSNTSILADALLPTGRQQVVIKVFRTLAPGTNPDVELPGVLAAAGTLRVPGQVGALRGAWTRAGRRESGDLAVVQEFIAGARDGWQAVLEAPGAPFAAAALGEATAEVHRLLAGRLGVRPSTPTDREAALATWRSRAGAAVAAVPALAELAPRIDAVLAAGNRAPWPPLRRIHGDLHLGQVIAAPGRGWVLLDFEGEPLRPLALRRAPDLALRDVAGMLRSFDYAAHAAGRSAGAEPSGWGSRLRADFLRGWAAASGTDPAAHRALLAALELDKALYEAQHRPDWLPIPLAGVARLLS